MFGKAVAITGILERIIQFVLLGLSALLFAYLGAGGPTATQQAWTSFGVAGLYVATIVVLYFVAHLLDARKVFAGKYLSAQDAPDSFGIFEIKSSAFGTEYKLQGTTYTGQGEATGTWTSDQITLHLEEREMQYIYWGRTVDGTVNGWGYSNVFFLENKMERGRGYFIDESKPGVSKKADRKDSRYLKLTPEVTKSVMGSADKAVGTSEEEREFVRAFAKLPEAERDKLIAVLRS